MKKFAITFIAMLVTFGLSAQLACSKYYPLKEGAHFELTFYDKKDKISSVVKYDVKEADADMATMVATIDDDKGEMVTSSEYTIKCEGDGISIDFKSLMGSDMLAQYKDVEMEITGTDIDLPNSLSVGQTLPDASMEALIKIKPLNLKMTVVTTDRKVTGMETVTTPAGTFDCVVISYTSELKMGIKKMLSAKQWYAKGVGLVKSEEYNKGGKLISKSLLTAFSD
ncbi:MAG: hypothetical protein KDC69_05960 [Flavobacteriaceae bacterium]|nr:hypothetical protein [Flavobacteriaceae bacterium]